MKVIALEIELVMNWASVNMKSNEQIDTRFIPVVRLLAGKLRPRSGDALTWRFMS